MSNLRSKDFLSKVALLAACLVLPVHAEEPRLFLPALIQQAAKYNPDIQAAERRWDAAKARIPQAQTLPDPRINLGYRELEMRETMYGFSQALPFPGKLRLRGEVAASEADISEQDYLAIALQVIAALKQAYYDLHFIHESESVLENTKRLLVQFEATAEARYGVGQGAQQDVFRAQAEISRLLARLATLEQKKQSLHAEINRLLNLPPADPLGTPEAIQMTPLKHKLEELNALLDQSAPLLLQRAKGVERGGKAVELAQRDYYPNFEVGALGLREEPTGKNGYQVMLSVEVPLYFQTKQRQAVREAQAGREAAVEDLQSIRQELLFRIKDNVAQSERAEQLVKLLGEAIIPQARLTLASAQAGYAVGKVDFLTLLNSLLTLQENEIERHGEMVEHEKALARLEAIIGEQP
jgi:cobalt-zinc-cadmium efflux system outer membrane protein